MNICIRVDSSLSMGSGHLIRCLTLADAVKERGARVTFISRDMPGNLVGHIESKGYPVYLLPLPPEQRICEQNNPYATWLGVPWKIDALETSAILEQLPSQDWLVVDNYALDASWESTIRPHVRRIMVIDDLADRHHDCDLLLDQNLHENMERRYEGLVPAACQTFLGPQYALLRQEFIDERRTLKERDGCVSRIQIFFGGSDPSNETTKALRALIMLNRSDIAVDVIVGAANPNKEQLRQFCNQMPNVSFYCNVNNMAKMMALADLAIGAGGSTTWERCFLGLPTITLIIAQNQAETTSVVAKRGAALNLGWYEEVNIPTLASAIQRALNNPMELKIMSDKAISIMGKKTDLIDKLLKE